MSDLYAPIKAHQIEVEQLFAGAVFVSPDTARETCGWLNPESFRDDRIKAFWQTIKNDYKAPGDQIGAAIQAGIYYDVLGWQSNVVSSTDSVQYANEIVTDDYLFKVMVMQNKIINSVNERRPDEVRALVADLIKDVPIKDNQIHTAVDVGLAYAETIYGDPPPTVKTGIPNFDRCTGGLEYGVMTVLAARPSMGKSTMGWQIARNVASAGKKALVFSLEMTERQLWEKAICGAARVDHRKVIAGELTDEQRDRMAEVNGEIIGACADRLYIDDHSFQTTDLIWQKTASVKPDLVIIDHLGLINDKEKDIVRRLGNVTWALHNMAKELNCHALVLCQLSRGTESRDNKRPTLSDLRWSGDIEQNADNVLFIYRPDYYESVTPIAPAEDSDTELIFGKWRMGKRAVCVKLRFNLLDQWFYERQS